MVKVRGKSYSVLPDWRACMKNSHQIKDALEGVCANLLANDLNEIDHPDPRHLNRLSYGERIFLIIDRVRHYYPVPNTVTVGDFGCAQANVGLLLAEEGYEVFAVDIEPKFLAYAQLKYESGAIHWIHGRIEADLAIAEESLDVVILGEVVEHCAFPEKVVSNALRYVKPGGLVIITTPNGARIKSNLPTFSAVLRDEKRAEYAARQFGPDQKDHLFQFTLEETRYLIPERGELVEWGYAGTSRLITNRFIRLFLRFLPVVVIKKGLRALAHIPWINARTFENIFVVLRKRN